jgi:hypothetical protein
MTDGEIGLAKRQSIATAGAQTILEVTVYQFVNKERWPRAELRNTAVAEFTQVKVIGECGLNHHGGRGKKAKY